MKLAKRKLISRIANLDDSGIDENFTDIIREGISLLNLDLTEVSKIFGAPNPTISRWLDGSVIPPAAKLILGFLKDELEK